MSRAGNGLGAPQAVGAIGGYNALVVSSLKQAIRCFKRGDFGKSCAYFCITFKLEAASNLAIDCPPDPLSASTSTPEETLSKKWKGTFLFSLDNYIKLLEEKQDFEGAINAYNESIDSFPTCEDIPYSLASFYCRWNKFSEAVPCLMACLAINEDYHLAHLCLENIKASAIARWHFLMINDYRRNGSFREAIRRGVQRGHDVVLDIGTGSGLLSMYALEAGAKQVFGCEVNDMLFHICGDILAKNGLRDKVLLFNEMSKNLTIPNNIPKKVTLLVTEIFDTALFGENCLSTIIHAWKHLIDPQKGLVIPSKASVYGVAVQSELLRKQYKLNWDRFGNIQLPGDTCFCVKLLDFKYTTENLSKLNEEMLYLSSPFKIVEVNFNDPPQLELLLSKENVTSLRLEMKRAGRLDAIAVWFELTLIDDDIVVSTQPPSGSIAWDQAIYFPWIEKTVEAREEVKLNVEFYQDVMELRDVSFKKDGDKKTIHLHQDAVRYLNATKFHETSHAFVARALSGKEKVNVLDLSYFPLVGLNCATLPEVESVDIITVSDEMEEDIQKFLNQVDPVFRQKVKIITYKQLVNCNKRKEWHLVLTDFVEPSGLLRNNLFEKLLYLKVTKFQSTTRALFFPHKIKIVGMLIESIDLLRRSRLTHDSNVHDLEVAQLLNVLETETIQEINLTRLDYASLSDHLELLTLDLNEALPSTEAVCNEPTNEISFTTTGSGEVHALVYWYLIYSFENCTPEGDDRSVLNTRSLDSNWHQAAFIMRKPFKVRKREEITLRATFAHGFVRVKVNVA